MAGTGEARKLTPEELRLRMQAEMTLLVWVRTCLGLMGFGFVVARFGLFLRELAEMGHFKVRRHSSLSAMTSTVGTGLIALGVVVLLCAVLLHRRFIRRLERGDLEGPGAWSLGVILALILAALGMVMAGYLGLAEF
jgi:putative membrane protein